MRSDARGGLGVKALEQALVAAALTLIAILLFGWAIILGIQWLYFSAIGFFALLWLARRERRREEEPEGIATGDEALERALRGEHLK